MGYGYYFKYAGYTKEGNDLGWWKIGFLASYEAWAVLVTLASVYAGIEVWGLMDARLKEAEADSIGVETPLTMVKGIKAFTLLVVAGLTTMISGYSLGTIVQPIIQWVDFYTDDVMKEGTDTATGDALVDGTSF